ncbi:MAG: hypothetical protein MJ171_01260 [Clostridia bacterium]|nr:hypothetical protein [Clostridia bacterium]
MVHRSGKKTFKLYVQTMYANIKNKSLPLSSAKQVANNTPEANRGTTLNESKPYFVQNVNSKVDYSSVLDNQVSLDDLLLELAQTNKTKAENFAARLTDAGEQIGMNLVFIPTSELSVCDTETVAVTSKPETKAEVKLNDPP